MNRMAGKMAWFKDKNLWNTYLFFLGFIGFLTFLQNPTAYTWAEQDMMPFWIHLFNSDLLVNDFFTQASFEKNPRWIYGYFVALPPLLFNLPWYSWLFIIKVLMLTLYPPVIFGVIIVFLQRFLPTKKVFHLAPYLAILLAIVVLSKDLNRILAVGNWLPYNASLYPANLSMFVSFIGIILWERRLAGRWLYLSLIVLGTLLHPVMGLLTACFYGIFLMPWIKNCYGKMMELFGAVLLSGIVVTVMFKSSATLNTELFIEYYVRERHPWHYHVPSYSNVFFPWESIFSIIALLILIPLFYGLYRRFYKLAISASLAFLGYVISIGLQYLFIDIIPVKLIAYLGPSRFTIFGFWSVLACWMIMIGYIVKNPRSWEIPPVSKGIVGLLFVSLFISSIIYLDHPFTQISQRKSNFFTFVRNTPPDAVFQAYSDALNTDIRLIGKRNVVVSKEFPFAESKIEEHSNRYKSFYGSRQEGEQGLAYFREITPKKWQSLAGLYSIDYIVIETNYDQAFKNIKPVWEDGSLKIFSIQTIQ